MSIVFFTFAGRTENMEVQRPHITALLDANPGSILHLWDLTRRREDQIYIRSWAVNDDRVAVMDQFHTGHPIPCLGSHRRGHRRCQCMIHKPPYEQPYQWYRDRPYSDDTTFVKFDDDVIWMDTARFAEVLSFLETRPDAVASANVVNNVVCAKYEPALCAHVRDEFGVGGLVPDYDGDWWNLHTRYAFAALSHYWMLANLPPHRNDGGLGDRPPVRTRPGEKISINFIAMKFPVLCRVAGMMSNRLGDEGAVDALLPWIISNFRVAHLAFGPQESTAGSGLRLDEIRRNYAAVPINREVTP